MAKDYYEILQVHPTAEPEIIRAAYKRLIQKYHPDKNQADAIEAERRTQEITEAYTVLSSPEQRARFDRSRSGGSAKPADNSSGDRRDRDSAGAAAARAAEAVQKAKREAAEEALKTAEARARQAEQARQQAENRAWQAEAAARVRKTGRRRRSRHKNDEGLGVIGWFSIGMAALGLLAVISGVVQMTLQKPTVETPRALPQAMPAASAAVTPPVTSASPPAPVDCKACPKMVKLSGGHFLMGAADGDEEAGRGEQPQHEVTVPPFAIAQTEVTQRLWLWVMNDNPSYLQGCMDCPVEKVSFDDVQAFLLRLNAMTGQNFRLPTEAEWEYACRAGADNRSYCGDGEDPHTLAWYNHNADGVRKVKTKKPNAFGLHDMSGNVWEWCQDFWHPSYHKAPADGSAWKIGGEVDYRVVRGGSWNSKPEMLRAAARQRSDISSQFNYLGFRLAQDAAAPAAH